MSRLVLDKRGAVLEASGSFSSRTEDQAAAVIKLLNYSNLYLKTQYSGADSLFKRLRVQGQDRTYVVVLTEESIVVQESSA